MIPDQLSPRAREIVVAARELLEEEGADAMSMRRVAERLGIRAPSLYKHFPDKQALENALVSDGFGELALAFEPARAVRDRIGALAAVYRAFALRHPHLYRLMTDHPLHREGLDPGVEDRAAAPLIEAVGGNTDLARAIWAFAHGMTILELNGRFPAGADLDAAWERGVEALGSRRSARSSA
jgi:AcrR family transcriptional regulator